MHPSPNISRSSVIGSVEKYEKTKKDVKEDFFSKQIDVSRQEKRGHICYISDDQMMSDNRDRQKTNKNGRCIKREKGHQKFSALKRNCFPKKGNSKVWSAKVFSRPPQKNLGAKSPRMNGLQIGRAS